MVLPWLNGGSVAKAWQPMSAATWVSPSSRCAILSALNTGRSGQPVQNAGGRFGLAPEEARQRRQHHLGHVLALGRHHVLAVDARGHAVVVGQRLQLL